MRDLTIDDYIQQLSAPEASVRANAAFILGRQRDGRVVQPLLDTLADPDPQVRLRVAEALGTRDEPEVVPPLIGVLQQDGEQAVRRVAARSLGYIGDTRATQPLIAALDDAEAQVRSQAAEALGSLGDAAAIDPLLRTLIEDQDENAQYFAKQSLLQLGSGVLDRVVAALPTQTNPGILGDLIEVLGQLNDPRAVPAIQPYAAHDDAGLQATAEWALSVLKP